MTRLRPLAATLIAATALTGCTTLFDDGYYGGVSGGYYDGYDYDYDYRGGYYDRGYDSGYYGWYGDYYYPGTGYYVYDRGGRRHAWNEAQRR